MNQFKILVDGRLLNRYATGISRYSDEVISSYIEKYGVNNVGIIVNDSYWTGRYQNIIVVPFKPFNVLHFIKFYSYLKTIKWEIFHSTCYSGLFFKVPHRVSVLTVHDLTYKVLKNYFSPNYFINKVAINFYDFIVSRSIKSADILISVSKTTAKDVMNLYGRESIIVPEGINEAIYLPEKGEQIKILERFELQKHKYFMYVGNLRKNKNILFMIESFIKSQSHNLLIIAGNNQESDIAKYPKSEKVKFIGYVSDSELAALYKNCIAFVFPSTYEGFGLPVLEALNNGAAVLCSNGGALKEFPSNIVSFFEHDNPTTLTEMFKQSSFTFNEDLVLKELKRYKWKENLEYMQKEISRLITKPY